MHIVVPVMLVIIIAKYLGISLVPDMHINWFIVAPFLGVIMIAVFMKGRKITKITEFETSQSPKELLDRNASAIKTHTGIDVTTNYEQGHNSWPGGSVHFYTKNEVDND